MPKVSVIIPNYNHAAYLRQRIESVLTQTFQDFEVILLDDSSTDNSKEIITLYANHPKVSKLLINPQNSGSTFKQWQKGIQESAGEYIWIAESDDYADKLFLEKLISILEANPSVGIAYCQSWMVNEEGEIIGSCGEAYTKISENIVHIGTRVIEKYMAGSNLIPNASAVVFRSSNVKNMDRRYTDFKFSGDWYFWCELLLRSDLIHIPDLLNYFRFHQNKVTVSASRKGNYFIEGLQVLYLLNKQNVLPANTYKNKSKNWANKFVELQSDKYRRFPVNIAFKILWTGCIMNKLFVKRVVYLLLRKISA